MILNDVDSCFGFEDVVPIEKMTADKGGVDIVSVFFSIFVGTMEDGGFFLFPTGLIVEIDAFIERVKFTVLTSNLSITFRVNHVTLPLKYINKINLFPANYKLSFPHIQNIQQCFFQYLCLF